MNIAVYCSSSNRIEDRYKTSAFKLGQMIAQNGDTLVFGGATGGLMDSVANGAHQQKGKIIGVIPQAVVRMNRQTELATDLYTVETMSERKAMMKSFADAFIVLPGSYGTLDEMLDIVASGIVGEHKKPIIIVNQDGFYNLFLDQIAYMRKESFMPVDEKYKPLICTEIEECIELIHKIIY